VKEKGPGELAGWTKHAECSGSSNKSIGGDSDANSDPLSVM
jgi:hypothetical protein